MGSFDLTSTLDPSDEQLQARMEASARLASHATADGLLAKRYTDDIPLWVRWM